MGQGTSKPYDSLILGCLAGDSSPCAKRQSNGHSTSDTIIMQTHPAWYNLLHMDHAANKRLAAKLQQRDPLVPQPDTVHHDSLAERQQAWRNSFAKDIEYVDHVHYNNALTHLQDDKCCVAGENAHVTWANITYEYSKKVLWLWYHNLGSLSANIGLAVTLQKLEISFNHLVTLPDAIGCLQNLKILNVAHNHLTALPDTIGHLKRLTELNISHNRLKELTPYIGHLTQLRKLHVGSNLLSSLPVEVVGLVSLVTLRVTNNPMLCALPAEILSLSNLQHIHHKHCPRLSDIEYTHSLHYNPPSLKELCARAIMDGGTLLPRHFPPHLHHYLASAKPCSACYQPYLDSHVSRFRMVDKADTEFLVEYRLCSAHWSDDDDRQLYAFSNKTELRPPSSVLCDLPPLPLLEMSKQEALQHTPPHISGTSVTPSVPPLSQVDQATPQKLLVGWGRHQTIKTTSRTPSNIFDFTNMLKRPSFIRFSPFSSSSSEQFR